MSDFANPPDFRRVPVDDEAGLPKGSEAGLPKIAGSSDGGDGKRDEWGGKYEFLVTLIGFAVGLGNLWRFPYLCFKNGGGAFLIPYFISVVIGGVPVFLLEVSLGHITRQGVIQAWKLVPLFQGVGYASIVIVFWCNSYYIIVLTWALYYLWSSFTTSLPWDGCDHDWNTASCYDIFDSNTTSNGTVDPSEEFFNYKMLQISGDINVMGTVRWELAISLAIAWMLCYFTIWKGVKISGKIVYFTALFPYVNLFVLLIRGVTLDGADKGLIYYFKPDVSRLADSQVWIDAGTQVFYSYGIGLGALTVLGSFNKPQSNVVRDTIIYSTVNTMTSVVGGMALFSVLGNMAHNMGVEISDVAQSGPGLVFIAFPKAISQLPIAPLWAVLFFTMIVFIGIDSQFIAVEGFVTSMMDLFPSLYRKKCGREIFLLVVCCLHFIIGLTMITNGGVYIFQLFDFYSVSGMALLSLSFIECIGIAYVFGGRRYLSILSSMIGLGGRTRKVMSVFLLFWYILTPAMSLGIFLFVVIKYSPLKYNNDMVYPSWGYVLGWSLALSSIVCPGVVAVIKIAMGHGTFVQRIKYLLRPQLYIDLSQYNLPDIGRSDINVPMSTTKS